MSQARKTVVLVLIALTVLSLAAHAADQIELRVAWWGSQDRHDRTLKAIELFEQKYPHIKVLPEYSGWADYWPLLTTQAAGRNLPDVMQQDYAYLGEWVKRGLLMPLDEFSAAGTLDLSTIAEAQLSGGMIDGKIYAISLGTNSLAMVFDPELFEKAGVEIPDTLYTWDEWVELCKTLHDRLGIFGAGENFRHEHIFKTWLKGHGLWLYNEDQTDLGYDDDSLYVEFFEMLLDLQRSGAMPTLEEETARAAMGLEDALIVSQQAAMDFAWSNMIVALVSSAGRPLKLGLMPQVGKPGAVYCNYLKPSMFFSVTSQARHPEEAALFVDFFTNDIEANKILMAERGVPIAPAVREALLPMLSEAQQEMFRFIDIAEQYSTPIDPPDPSGHNNIMQNVFDILSEQVLYGDIDPAVAAEEFRIQAISILKSQ